MRLSRTLLTIAAFVCLVSCVRRPLDVLATGLRIDLTNDYSLPFEPAEYIPEHYRVNMYDPKGGKLVYKDFVPEPGGMIRSMPGDYVCFVCNFDAGHLILSGEDNVGTVYLTAPQADAYHLDLYEACYRKLLSIRDGNGIPVEEATDVLNVENYFWAGVKDVTVPVLTPTDDIYTIYANTNSVLKQGYVTFNNIQGSEYISKIDCFVTNLCAGVNPVTRELDTRNIAQTFTIGSEDGRADGTFLYFGALPGRIPVFLYALVTDTGGGQYLYIYDLGPIDDERGLHFDIDSGMDIPEPSTGGGGFQPALGDWDTEIIRVPIGVQ